MHNNYFFLRHLSAKLKIQLAESRLLESFSQNKDELVLVFLLKDNSFFYLLANLGSEFSCLTFPKDFHKAKRNIATLFPEVAGSMVQNVSQKQNERAFSIHFHNGASLVFKLFGNRANVILFQHTSLISLFKNSLKADKVLDPQALDRTLDINIENFIKNKWDIKKVLFTLGPLGEQYLMEQGFAALGDQDKYAMILDIVSSLEIPAFYISRIDKKVVLSLFNMGEVLHQFADPMEAINTFYAFHFRVNHLEKQKELLKNKIQENIAASNRYLDKLRTRAAELDNAVPYGQIADILMANLHAVPKASEKIKLFDFYRNQEIEIKLKKDLTPQKNAEQFYRKEKNRHLEINNLNSQISQKLVNLGELQKELISAEEIKDYRSLEEVLKNYQQSHPEKKENEIHFKTFSFAGFNIFVGRNAGNNDELTQQFAHKDDLWLHAKDVTGSHVVIRHQAGKPFPKNVIERAAAVAAFYSKRKNESLCPVTYTLKKYVRKVKGAPKGAVKIEKEQVIMVVPSDI